MDVWHVDPTKSEHGEVDKAKAVATFQQWADDGANAKRRVDELFNDRRGA